MKDSKKLLIIFVCLLSIILFSISCGSGGGGGGSTDNGGQNPPQNTGTPIPLELTLNQSDFWEFFWTSETITFSQPDNTTSSFNVGRYRVTLGSPLVISGLNAYPLEISGETIDETRSMAPRWTHFAIDKDVLWGSQDGITLQAIYDGSSGNWSGGGVFIEFAANETITPTNDLFNGNYNNMSAITVGHATSEGGCETILGHTICNDDSTQFREKEYLKEGIGPLGYTLAISYSSSGGNFYTSTQINRTIELVDTNHSAMDGSPINQPPWSELANMPAARQGHAATVLNNIIYIIGGLDAGSNSLSSVVKYDPVLDSWSSGTAMPVAQSGHIAETYNGKIYVIPCCSNRDVLIYDPIGNNWTTGATIPFDDPSLDGDVWDHATFSGIAIATPNGAINGDLQIYGYNVPTNQWFTGVLTYTFDQRWFSANIITNTLYVIGGYQQYASTKVFSRARPYNLVTDVWGTLTNPLKEPRYDHSSVVLSGKLYVLGGRQSASGPKLRSAEVYDPSTNNWSEIIPMFHPRDNFASVVLNGEIYAIGGNDGNGAIAEMEVYTP